MSTTDPRQIVITGIGAVTPAGIGVDRLWRAAREGRSLVRRIDRFDVSAYRCQVAAQADGFDAREWLPGRMIKKTDRFTHLAVAAAGAALDDAGLRVGGDGVAPERVGVMVGNVLGGWDFAERELRRLWVEGPRRISPYQATAWFPAAPQGNICIRYGIKGRARTFVCDRASGAYAVAHAAETIRRGQADAVLAGGTEQPLSPYAWLCCQTGSFLTPAGNRDPARAYRPFDRRHTGTVLGEGSVFLVLESREHAERRGAPVLATLAGWALNNDGYMPYYTNEPHGGTLSRAVTAALTRAGLPAERLGCVFADGSGVPRDDSTESLALAAAVGRSGRGAGGGNGAAGGSAGPPVTTVKPVIGHLMGAATTAEIAVAVRALAAGEVPPVANLDTAAPGIDLDLVTGAPRPVPGLESAAVVARGLGGVNACLVLTREPGGGGRGAG
jgi:3-oxoacyl-(acyl-carrier-protein) synthase